MAHILDVIRDRVLLCDGAMGTAVHGWNLDLERDFLGKENCIEVLNQSRADVIRSIHLGHFRAGADLVQTNSFGGSPITLSEFGLADQAFAINRRAGEIAREAVVECAADGRDRFVIGSIGPGTRLPSLGHVDYQTLEDALAIQAAGLIAGGVDAILAETCQDPLQIKAAVNAAKRARVEANRDVPVFVQVTVETTGTLLVGPDIAAAATIVKALDVPLIGLNCGTGPREMSDHLKWLSENWTDMLSVQPNAGLPELLDGKTHYPLTATEFAPWIARFVREDGANLVGGCCGTETSHIAALDAMLREAADGGLRPRPKARQASWAPSVASLYGQTPLRQENAYLSIGERCNANGSKRFRELQERGDWDGAVEMARAQVKDGSHALDLCTAFVGRDEIADMSAAITKLAKGVNAPLSIDTTELPVLEAALKLYGGKPIVNSINLEDGEETLEKKVRLAKRFGAACIALTIDEEGMAKEAPRKLAVARRIHDLASTKLGLAPSDLLFDPLTFTICTGSAEDRRLGLETLDAIESIAKDLPECQIILGLSNISFGLGPAARSVLNSVFLEEALKRGMTGAILHVSKIVPFHKIPENEAKTALDLIYDRRRPDYDPLQAFIALYENRTAAKAEKKVKPVSLEERLKARIVDGDRSGLDADLEVALQRMGPLDIINNILLDGMKTVGDLFGAGKMQLPFVLQSAETMKAAVAYLEPHMERIAGSEKGTIVLATVKGDVHDIGKNLVDILLTNNGFKVVNLGIKQPLNSILEAAENYSADAVGMSGLLVKSTVVMRENLEEMNRRGIGLPVILGGAALTRRYVDEDCAKAYGGGAVAYARDAFEGLALMNNVVNGTFVSTVAAQREKIKDRPVNQSRRLGRAAEPRLLRPVELEEIRLRRAELARGVPVPRPPFWGPRTIARVPLKTVVPYLNERMLYQFHWGFRKQGRTLDEFKAWAKQELRPTLNQLLERVAQENILVPQAAYGYWPCAAAGDELVLYDPETSHEAARFSFPRQNKPGGLCIADFFRDVTANERDVVGLQVVTMGHGASEVARQWFADNRYKDYLYLHGLSVEMAEALAEYLHQRIRAELGFAGEEPRDVEGLLRQEYRGSRYSFGYPACPDLAQQRQLLTLLRAQEIGVSLTDEDQLDPEQSTSAIVVVHSQAKYFSV
jgi:5-methyltetrahydrofolate--homocysteine methyltransferase